MEDESDGLFGGESEEDDGEVDLGAIQFAGNLGAFGFLEAELFNLFEVAFGAAGLSQAQNVGEGKGDGVDEEEFCEQDQYYEQNHDA